MEIAALHAYYNPVNNTSTRHYFRPVATGFFSDTIFPIIAAEMIPMDQKNGLERRVSRFCTICDKNQLLNQKRSKKKLWQFQCPDGPKFLIWGLNFGSKSLYAKIALCISRFFNFKKNKLPVTSYHCSLGQNSQLTIQV
jgi:hypothetical protein